MAESRRLRMTVAYDGTAYRGWQVQAKGDTVQAQLQRVLGEITQAVVKVHGSGRTDTGVHARGQVAHFDSPTALAPRALQRAMNALLPADIRVAGLRRAAPDFHARFDAVGKEYRYYIYNGPEPSPFVRNYRHHLRARLDLEAMRRAAVHLRGEHDFAAFSANPGRERHGTVRRVDRLDLGRRGHTLTLRVHGNGFLYKMVRSMAGALIRVGLGELEPEALARLRAVRRRGHDVPTAPARGLFLWRVDYPDR